MLTSGRTSEAGATSAGRSTLAFLAAVVAVDSLAFALVLPLLPVLLREVGASTALVVAVFATFSLCQALAAPWWGRLADRIGRRPVLLVSQLGTAVGFMLLAWAPTPTWLVLARAVDGITAGNLAVVYAVVCDRYPERARSAALGLVNGAGVVGVVAGLGAAAVLADGSLARLALVAAAATALTLLLGVIAPLPPAGGGVAVGRRTASLRAAIGTHRALQAAALALLACQVVIAALVAAMTVLLHDAAGYPARRALIVVLVALVVGAGAQLPLAAASVRRYGSRRAVVISFGVLLGGIAMLTAALAVGPEDAPVVLGAVLTATGGLSALSTATAALSESSDLGAGWVMGLSQSVAALGQLLGPALGILAVSLGAPVFLAGAAAVALLGAVAVRGPDRPGTTRA